MTWRSRPPASHPCQAHHSHCKEQSGRGLGDWWYKRVIGRVRAGTVTVSFHRINRCRPYQLECSVRCEMRDFECLQTEGGAEVRRIVSKGKRNIRSDRPRIAHGPDLRKSTPFPRPDDWGGASDGPVFALVEDHALYWRLVGVI